MIGNKKDILLNNIILLVLCVELNSLRDNNSICPEYDHIICILKQMCRENVCTDCSSIFPLVQFGIFVLVYGNIL